MLYFMGAGAIGAIQSSMAHARYNARAFEARRAARRGRGTCGGRHAASRWFGSWRQYGYPE